MAKISLASPSGGGKPTFIYALIDPLTREARYVGKTILPFKKRLQGHYKDARAGNRWRTSRWLLALERAGLKPDIVELEVVPFAESWAEAERFWIEYLKYLGARLTNATLGGEGAPGRTLSADTIEKMRRSHIGKPLSDDHRAKLKEAARLLRESGHKRPKWTDERRAKTIKAITGKPSKLRGTKMTPEQCARIREARRKCDSPEMRAKISMAKRGKKMTPSQCADLAVAQRARRERERTAGPIRFSAAGLANIRAAQKRRRAREKALGVPGAPRPPQYQIDRLIAGRRRKAAEQNAAKTKKDPPRQAALK